MKKQFKWLNEILNDNPKKFEEYFYPDIQNYLGISTLDDKNILRNFYNICSKYADEFNMCNNKYEVKIWLNKIAFYVINNFETESLIDNFFNNKK